MYLASATLKKNYDRLLLDKSMIICTKVNKVIHEDPKSNLIISIQTNIINCIKFKVITYAQMMNHILC